MTGCRKGAEFTIGMNNVEFPEQELFQYFQGNRSSYPCIGIYGSNSHGANIVYGILHVGTGRMGKCQNPNLMAAFFQAFAQIQDRGYNPVDCGGEPIGSQQYFHKQSTFFCCIIIWFLS